jgi:hypothetical protein
MSKYSDEFIANYEKLLEKVKKDTPDNTFFINMLKDTIFDLRVKQRSCEDSKKYLENKQ